MSRRTRAGHSGRGGSAVPALVALVVLAGIAVAAVLAVPRPAGSGAGQFSAQRAFGYVSRIARAPHPVGSPADAAVRDYLVHALRRMGLRPRVRSQVARRAPGSDAEPVRVHDIHARIPGSASTGHVVLVAHYDSVPAGPGAADDAANVAAILEIARTLAAGPGPRNDVDIVFTDGEEAGLLGAKAFVRAGVLDPRRAVVLNLEARGTCGQSVMFQTSTNNARLLPALPRDGGVAASSLATAVYRVLPNDTDFTVFRDAGYAGLNFAFIGCSVNYHTRRDTPANLSLSSLREQGAAVFAATRYFAAADVPALHGGGRLTYFRIFGRLVWYPQWLVLPLAILAAAAVVGMLWSARRRGARLRAVAVAAAGVPALTAIIAAVAAAVAFAVGQVGPGYGDPAAGDHGGVYAAVLAVIATAVVLGWFLLVRRLGRCRGAAEVALGIWSWPAALAVAAAVLLPGAAYLLTWPVLAGCLALTAAFGLRAGPRWQAVACCAAAAPAIVLLVPLTPLLWQTFPALPAPLLVTGVLLALASPLLYLLVPARRGDTGEDAVRR